MGDLKALGAFVDLILENPRTAGEGSLSDSRLLIKGWILPKPEVGPVRLWLTRFGERLEISIDRPRPDVLAAHAVGDEFLDCGFQLLLPAKDVFGGFQLSVQVGDSESAWFQVMVEHQPELGPLERIWNADINDRWEDLRHSAFRPPGPAEVKAAVGQLALMHRSLASPQALDNESWIDATAMTLLRAASGYFSAPGVALLMAQQLLEAGRLEFLVPDSGARFVGTASLGHGDVVFLRFATGDDCFYVVQYCQSASALYYPRLNLSIAWPWWADSVPAWVRLLNQRLFSECEALTGYFSSDVERRFGGFVVGNSRPFHFFYDQVTTVQQLLLRTGSGEDAGPAVDLYLLGNFVYLSLAPLLGPRIRESLLSRAEDLNPLALGRSLFFVLIGESNRRAAVDRHAGEMLSVLPALIKATRPSTPGLNELLDRMKRHFPVFWVGVTGQKRRWVEQEEGLVRIIRHLQQTFPSLLVIFDGWTSPLQPSAVDQAEIGHDREVVERIAAGLPAEIEWYSLVGASSEDKIRVGTGIDFYLTNWLQGSLHVDNICRKHGVGHFNTLWNYYEDLYDHHHCLRIDDVWITNEGSARPDLVSYRIDPVVVYAKLVELLDSLPLGKLRPLAGLSDSAQP